MPRAHLRPLNALATGTVLAALASGCERPSEGKAGPSAQPARSVEIIHPERQAIRRSVGEPGELEAFETTAIHAKIAGYVKNWTVNIVTQRNVNTGDLTQTGADKPPLFIVARSDIMTIRVNVPEAFAAEVNPGDRATVRLQEMKNRTVEGKVTRISWALDPETRTIRVEIDIPNPGAGLQPGLYAYATVIAEERPDVMALPVTALVSGSGKHYCVAIIAGNAARRSIKVGLSDGSRTEVVSGLDGREAVVKANAGSLADGQAVEVVDPANPSPPSAKP